MSHFELKQLVTLSIIMLAGMGLKSFFQKFNKTKWSTKAMKQEQKRKRLLFTFHQPPGNKLEHM